TRTAATACRALGAARSGRTATLRTCASEAAGAIDAMGDVELETFLDEVGQLGLAEVLGGRHGDAVRHLARGVRVARRTGHTLVLPHLLLYRSHAQQATGDLDGALASAADAEEAARLIERPESIGHALALRAAVTAVRSGPTAAIPGIERALGPVSRCGRLWELSTSVLAPLLLDQGRPDECLEILGTVTGTDRSAATHALRPQWFATAARAAVALGDARAARAWSARATESAESVDLPGQRGYGALAQAAVDADAAAAAESSRRAADLFAEGGLVLAECHARLLLGHHLTGVRDIEGADTAVGRAKQLADAVGSAHLGALAVDAQRRIGARRPREGRRDPLGAMLSEQERRISELAAGGLSNRRIATDLYISTKTVEGHLTRVFRKLRITSRAGLSAALAGLPDPSRG
ncbi:helix-turn-helix transcriptional regulator, partial [Streptomyces sp. NPDC054956]